MLVSKDCLNLALAKNAQTGDNFIWLSGAEAYKLNAIGVGNHIHLTLSDNRGCETVRYDHNADWANTSALKQIPVIRNVSGTGSRNFAVHSCVTADWSVAQITELITQAACEGPCITSLSTGLSTTNSAVSSLSTIVSTGLSTTNSAVASLSTAIGGGTSSLTSLSTSTSTTAVSLSTGLGAVNSAVASLSTIVATKADLVSGTVPASQLPSHVDDVLEFPNLASFPTPGEAGKIYADTSTNLTYRWSGTTYVPLGGDYSITSRDQGVILTTATTDVNYVGQGVTATNSGGLVTVTVHDASDTQVGSVELATPAETIVGTSNTVAVTPQGLLAALAAALVNSPELVDADNTRVSITAPNDGITLSTFTMPKDGFIIVEYGSSIGVGGAGVAIVLMDINRTSSVHGSGEIGSARQVFAPYSASLPGGDYLVVTSSIVPVAAGDTIYTRMRFDAPANTPCDYTKYARVKYLN